VRKAGGKSTEGRSGNKNVRELRRAGAGGSFAIERRFTTPGRDPFGQVVWIRRKAVILNESGGRAFEQDNVAFPEFWSELACNIVASKYFIKSPGKKESSLKELISRVVSTIARWGKEGGYLRGRPVLEAFRAELSFLLLHQYASFNSPVWFNVGVSEHPQCSACFITSVQDSMESILDLAKTEGMLFKYGSGTGTNLSPLRSSKERLSGGGTASGPVSFMKGYDSFAGVIKSGGRARRAAKMVVLNVDHPDIVEFIRAKELEERKAWALIDAGYEGAVDGEAYRSVFFQNSNNSVRVPDEFMKAALSDGDWETRFVTTGKPAEKYRARELLRMMCEAAHLCGDPGVQFDTTANAWNTCPNSGRINASNPCGEFLFLDDSACNLASLNLLRFMTGDGDFDHEAFEQAIRVLVAAQEIIIDNASYPTKSIEANSKRFRPLGLGYANLGAYLMASGLPYDSEEGRALASAVTSLMTASAYKVSAEMAGLKGPFEAFEKNRGPMLEVLRKHLKATRAVRALGVSASLLKLAEKRWEEAIESGERFGFRNAQVTAIAPTGTIGFMMDCDTMGVEPDIALVKEKRLVGGGVLKVVNRTVPRALERLGYSKRQVARIAKFIAENGTIEGAPGIQADHLPAFDCAFKPSRGARSIPYQGHLRMMAAVQPFVSGGISKTINMPHETTPEDVMDTYISAWKMGLKSISVYRDRSKRTQPVSVKGSGGVVRARTAPRRKRLPDERKAVTHKFSIAGHEGYLTVGMFEDGSPGEIFIVMAKEGSVVSGLMDTIATMTSMALQYGVPLRMLVRKFSHVRFEPSGFTTNPEIPIAKSVIDYIFRWLALKFLSEEERADIDAGGAEEAPAASSSHGARQGAGEDTGGSPGGNESAFQADGPPCPECGAIMILSGSCYHCRNCGDTTGCA